MKLAKKPVAISSMDSKTDPDQFDQFFHFAENQSAGIQENSKFKKFENSKIKKTKR
jgi:hypothetical protein